MIPNEADLEKISIVIVQVFSEWIDGKLLRNASASQWKVFT